VITQQNSNIGIGTSTPNALFSVGSGSPFQVNSLGTISSMGGFSNLSYVPNAAVTTPGVNSTLIFQPSLTATSNVSGYASSNYFGMAPTGSGTNNSQYVGVQVNHFKQTTGSGAQTSANVVTDSLEIGGGSTSYGNVAVESASANLYTTSANISNLSLFNGSMSWNGGGYTGTLTNLYGLYLGPMTGATNNYAIYSAGGQNYLAGTVGIGTSTPSAKVDIEASPGPTTPNLLVSDYGFAALGPSIAQVYEATSTTNNVLNLAAGSSAYTGTLGLWYTNTNASSAFNFLTLRSGASGNVFNIDGKGDVLASGQIRSASGYVFPDGTTQSTAGVVPSFTGTTALSGSLSAQGGLIAGAASPALLATMTGAVTIASSAADGQGSASHGLLFVDDFYGAASAWTHAAIYTVGASGYNGNLVFATDGDNSADFGVTEKMRVTSSGSVGIGTSTPGAMLEVKGNVKLTAGSGASMTYQDGSVQTVAWNGVLSGGDYAESVDVIGDRTRYEPGDVLVIDPASKGKFSKSTEAYSTAVMGIYSTRPGVVGRRQTTDKSHMKDEVPMAMVGVVPTKVSTENGPVRPGDLLVTSSTPGYAMRGSDRSLLTGAIIGKALEPLQEGAGVIEVAVSIQ
jgi:hypothetical protein